MQESDRALVNGLYASQIQIADRGFQYGDGVFTTLPIESGRPLLLKRHLERLERDAGRINILCPDLNLLWHEANCLAGMYPSGVLKIILTRGQGGRGYRCPETPHTTRVLSVHPAPEYPNSWRRNGVAVHLCESRLGHNSRLAGVKHLNRLEQVLARAEWEDDETREGLVMDQEGFVIEGVMSNLFILDEGSLRTPSLDRCGVNGVMRNCVMDLARLKGLGVTEERITLAEVLGAHELFLTNSVIRLWPVRRIGDRMFPVQQSDAFARDLDRFIQSEGRS